MKSEMETVFSTVDKMQEEHEVMKKQMIKDKQRLMYRREMLAKQVSQLNQDIEHKKKKLQDSDTHQQLEVLEKSLRHYAQNNYHIQEYILTKGIESDYSQVIISFFFFFFFSIPFFFSRLTFVFFFFF